MRRRHCSWGWIIAIGILASCGDGGGPFEPGEERELARAQTRWENAGIVDYNVDFRLSCFFCNSVFTRLEVRAGQVVAAEQLEPLPYPVDVPLTSWPTVPAVFQKIVSAVESKTYHTIDVDYDPEFGYPQRIALGCGPHIADCDMTYELRNLEVIGSIPGEYNASY